MPICPISLNFKLSVNYIDFEMGPLILAFLLNCSGIYIYTKSIALDYLPFVAYIIFLLSVFYLLWDMNIKPSSFRQLYFWAEFVIEFGFSMLFMEMVMNYFWLPLQMAFITLLPTVSDFLAELMRYLGVNCKPCELPFLKLVTTLYIASYLLSTFFLLCVLHATRIIDLRLLRHSLSMFMQDVTDRSHHFYVKTRRNLKSVIYPGKKTSWCKVRAHSEHPDPSNYSEEFNMSDDVLSSSIELSDCHIVKNKRFF